MARKSKSDPSPMPSEEGRMLVSRRGFLKGMSGTAITAAVAPQALAPAVVAAAAGAAALEEPKGISRAKITLKVNGQPRPVEIEPRETLLDVLRERLDLTGAKLVCDRGECGGCTVLVDGDPVYACMMLAIDAQDREITTIEGLARGGTLHPLQQAFIEHDGYQCGFCTPGQVMSSVALLQKNPNPTLDEVKNAVAGNLCRCGTYTKIFESVLAAAETMKGGK
jgi:xanthine dehydrogenase YagT iron-sulfur-binding subunit